GQLNHAGPDPGIAGAGQPFLAPLLAAFVRGAGQPGVTRHRPAVAQRAREHLDGQHVGGRRAEPVDLAERTDLTPVGRGSLLPLLLAGRLDLLQLRPDQGQPRQLAAQLGPRQRRQCRTFAGAQLVQPNRGAGQFDIDVADAEPGQARLHAVDDAAGLARQALPLAVEAARVRLGQAGARRAAAILPLPAPPWPPPRANDASARAAPARPASVSSAVRAPARALSLPPATAIGSSRSPRSACYLDRGRRGIG